MTCGIYKLNFIGTTKVYIGKGTNIENRFSNHITKFTEGTHSIKMQSAYTKYGKPTLEILLECDKHQLNENENLAIEIFDAVSNGFNTAKTAEDMPCYSAVGEDRHNSKHYNAEIVQACMLLADPTKSMEDIYNITGVSRDTLASISCGRTYSWLKEVYPEVYQGIQDSRIERKSNSQKLRGSNNVSNNSSQAQGIQHPALLSPSGIVYRDIPNVNAFAREHGLDPSHLHKLLKRKLKSCKGWKLV